MKLLLLSTFYSAFQTEKDHFSYFGPRKFSDEFLFFPRGTQAQGRSSISIHSVAFISNFIICQRCLRRKMIFPRVLCQESTGTENYPNFCRPTAQVKVSPTIPQLFLAGGILSGISRVSLYLGKARVLKGPDAPFASPLGRKWEATPKSELRGLIGKSIFPWLYSLRNGKILRVSILSSSSHSSESLNEVGEILAKLFHFLPEEHA